ncbi:MAG TPA: polysaccharide deacetylase family protein [Candidatus Limnocylindrales bacterium]
MSWLATWVADGDARRRWALAHLLELAGIPARPVDGLDAARPGPLLVLGPALPAPGVLAIPISGPSGPADWERAIDPSTYRAGAGPTAALPIDVVAIVADLLTDGIQASPPAADLDAHGRLTYAASAPARAGLGETPIVDRIANEVAAWIRAATGIEPIERWPEGRRAAVGLSHDVDHPDRYGVLRAVRRNPLRVRSAPRTLATKAGTEARRRLRDPDPEAFWAFDELIASEARRGFRSSYLFATSPFHGPWGSPFDVAYDVGEARFRSVFARLREAGNEIGLHTGYLAFAEPGRIGEERRRLLRAAGAPIEGNRHHYWHLGPDAAATLREHEAAGFTWDSSLGFNEHPGFRRSTALPFFPWDETLGRPLRVLQIPTTCMDGSLLYRSSEVAAAVATVEAQLGAIARAGGAMTLDWHLQASVPTNPEYRAWADVYQATLDLLEARSDVWVRPLGEIEAWWRSRRARLVAAASD